MKIKSEKGYTGVDIAISIVVLFIFVSLIAILSYNFNSSAKEMELKSEAIAIAIDEIEAIKNIDFDEVKDLRNKAQYITTQEVAGKQGFYKTVMIEDYADNNPDITPGLVKKVTVLIQYMFKGKEQTIELSTILSKES